MGMIEWYQQGSADSYSDARKAKLKKQAKEWLELLNEEYEDGNRVGANTLYQTTREKYPEKGKHPSRPFVTDFLERQGYQQKYKRAPKGSDPVQAVMPSNSIRLALVACGAY